MGLENGYGLVIGTKSISVIPRTILAAIITVTLLSTPRSAIIIVQSTSIQNPCPMVCNGAS